MKIAHLSWEFPPVIYGGLGTYITEITHKQAYFGNEVTVFSLNRNNALKTYEKWNGVEVYRPRTLDLTSTFNLFANYELRSWGEHFKFFSDVISYNTMSASQLVNLLVRREKKEYDIIVAHDWLGILGGMIIKQELGTPLMFHIHSTEIGRSLGRGSHAIKDIEFEGGQNADCIITVSNTMKDELEKFEYPSDKIRVCWNGVDPFKYDPTKVSEEEKRQLRKRYGINDDENILFFIGRLVTIKGVRNLIKAMPYILEEFPKVKLIVLGIGDLEWELKDLTNKLGIQDKVIFRTEFIDEKERIIHFAVSDCVVLPSSYEPFGIVCTESMSMAKPTIVGAKGTSGFREQIISNGEKQCGIHINPHDSNDIAWGVKEILRLEDKGNLMGKNARERVLEIFNWESVAKRTLDIYKDFI